MIRDIGIDDVFKYDGDTCFSLYLQFVDGKITEDHFIRYLKRYVVMRVRKTYYRRLRREVCEDLVQTVLVELFQVARKHKLPTSTVQVFHAFMNTIIRCNIAKGFKKIYDDSPKLMDPATYIESQMARIPGTDESETHLFLEDLYDDIKGKIVRTLRWKDSNHRDAAAYVVDQINSGKRAVPSLLRRVFEVKDPEFFIQHIGVRLRAELYEARESLSSRPDTEKKEILTHGVSEYFGEE